MSNAHSTSTLVDVANASRGFCVCSTQNISQLTTTFVGGHQICSISRTTHVSLVQSFLLCSTTTATTTSLTTMKFCATVVLATVFVLSTDTDAFTTRSSQRRQQVSTTTSLSVTTLDEWQLLENGSIVGSVRNHPTLADGDIITTSPLSRPDTARNNNLVTTLTGSQYKLGFPISRTGGGASNVEEPSFGRSSFVRTVGTASLFAGGVALGVGVGGIVNPPMTIPEVRSLEVETVEDHCVLCRCGEREFTYEMV